LRKYKTFGELTFYEDGSTLVTLVGVLLVDGGVVLARVVAAFEDGGDKVAELRVGVLRVVNVRR